MKLSTIPTSAAAVLGAALAGVLCCGGLQAANLLTAAPGTIALTCNTLNGPGPAATIVVKPAAALTTNAIAVTLGGLSAELVVTPLAPAVLTSQNQSQGITYTVSLAAGCAAAANGTTTIRFYAGGVADVAVTASTSVTAVASALVASPVTITCVRNTAPAVSYTPGPSATALLISAAPGGTPFVVDFSTVPAWLALPPTTATSAGATGVRFTLSAVSPCGNYLVGSSYSASVHLRNPPAPDGLIPVTLKILSPSPLTATPGAPSLAYTKGSGAPAFVDVAVSSAGSGAAFAVDPNSLPTWLTVDALSGSVPKTLHFTTTSVADAIAQGTYGATVHLQDSGFGDLAVPFRLTVSNPPPTLTVAEGTTRNITWTVGQPLPIPYITLTSSDSPIPYAIVTGGPLAPIVGSAFLKGFAYSYDTPIPVTFDPGVFAAAQPGSVLTGTVSITWGNPAATTVITIKVTVQPAGATLLSVTPPSLPTAVPGQTFTVALTGTGFIASADAAQATMVGIVSGGSLLADANIAAAVINPSNIILTITVPAAADPLLPFAAAGVGGTVTLGVCNPLGAACTVPTGTAALLITANPTIQAVTNAAAFLQVTPPALPAVSPYGMISLFGASFCVSGGTGCTGGQVLYGSPDAVTLRYPVSLSPDASGSAQRLLTVGFQTHATPPAAIANAPLLFATNGQINLLVPAALSAYVGKSVDLMVNFGHPPAAGMLSSAPFPVNVVAADPGVFTIEADGQGQGAILNADWSVVATGNEAGMRANPADSDMVQIYMTGLGAPDSTANNTATGAGQWPADCVGTGSYLAALNFQTGGSLSADGALIEGSLLNGGRLPPCLSSAAAVPTVTIGGQPATVAYAGWVANSVAGEYQVNVRLPGSAAGAFTSASGAAIAPPLAAAVQLPVVVAARGVASQPGVTIWVTPRLKVTGPSALQGASGVSWPASGNLVTASQGTPGYQFAVTGGSLPAGLTLGATSGAISGIPAAAKGSYVLTVTATDSAASPLSGSVTFTLTVE
ncbi:MAG: putative Ig domain-containing protein [Candidatus Solibacter sp.]|jgi:uncharacterized protein (TIGR03437 family)